VTGGAARGGGRVSHPSEDRKVPIYQAERLPPDQQKNAIFHWKEDIQRAANYKEMAKQILKEKTSVILEEGGIKYEK